MSFGAFSRVESGARFWPALFACLLLAACGSDPEADDGTGGGGSDAGSGGTASGGDGSGGSASGGSPGTGGGSVEVEARAARITAGKEHNCAIEEGGAVFCWGTGSPSVLTAPDGTFSQISAIDQTTCGIAGGAIECWGVDTYIRGAIPDGSFAQVVASEDNACALDASGVVECWGRSEANGGVGIIEDAPTTSLAWLARGTSRVCGATAEGVLTCWGFLDEVEPSSVSTLDANSRWCAIQSGAVTCSGPSLAGLEPTGTNFVQVATGRYIACAIASDGHVSCWGTEAVAPPDDLFVEISAGERHACGITSSGLVRCWGAGGSPEATTPREIKVF